MTLLEAKRAGVQGFWQGYKRAIDDAAFMSAIGDSDISEADLIGAYDQGVRAAKLAARDLENGLTASASIGLVNTYLAA